MSSPLRYLRGLSQSLKKLSPSLHTKVLNVANRSSELFMLKITDKGKGNKVDYSSVLFKTVKVRFSGNNNTVTLGKNAKLLNVTIHVKGSGHNLFIGENCIIQNSKFWFEDDNSRIAVGEGTDMRGAAIAVTEPSGNITIGDGCLFAAGLDIRNGDSHSILDKTTGKRINYASDISIADRVWIGRDVSILKGARISSESVIGTRSLVPGKQYPANVLIAGVPAKVVKENITWDAKRIYDNV
ncbi:hypothetical protein LT679_07980 [Mucilaginibacter roseus]|uniref:Acyltransferase n=1 Tax=Mucilaginibacter roseus TaxID=1528868 RepID=A0ABS8U3Y7_9SPHI|nr:hypothetical protein [Mucilaginibacter roseus]MCD8740537.1 hypothetical protein [Mucilaginibacter roseus]